MISNIISEDFEVTPAIRDHVDKCLNELLHFVPNTDEDMQVRFFLKQEADQLFSATLRAHFWSREFVATHRSPNLYQAVTLAKRHLVRQVNHVKGRRSAMKRKPAPRVPIEQSELT
jgi:ribosomal subunit interface protein